MQAESIRKGREEQDHPHACHGGWIYLGYTALDHDSGEEMELIERIPCRRCVEEGE